MRSTKIIATILTVLMMAMFVPATALADAANPTFSGGSGTEDDPFLISTVDDLAALDEAVERGNGFKDEYFKLTDDISSGWNDFRGVGSNSDPTTATPFSATFDGAGHTLSGLTLDQGLFACVSDLAHIKNLTVEGTVNARADNAGMIVGSVVDGVGSNLDGVVAQCTARGTVNGGTHANIGGIAGNVQAHVPISSCLADCSITSTASGNANVGGIVGLAPAPWLTSCTWTGTITAAGDNVGGLVGSVEGALRSESAFSVSASYVEGTIAGGAKVGGVIGSASGDQQRSSSDLTISNCRIQADVTGTTDVGGVLGYNDAGSAGMSTTIDDNLLQGTVTATDATSGYAGGIVGYAVTGASKNRGATPSFNAIILDSVTGGANADDAVHAGAVWGGSDDGINKPSWNYTWRHMLLNGSEVVTGGVSSQNGEEIGRCQLYDAAVVPEPMDTWSTNVWTIEPAHAPLLNNLPAGSPAQTDWPPYQPIEVADSEALSHLTYTGEPYTFQNLDVTYKGEPLAFNTDMSKTDYTIVITDSAGNTVEEATDAGNYKLTITTMLLGKAGCRIARTYDVCILPESLADAEVSGTFQKTYNGKPQVADIQVALDGRSLVEGTDYVVHYTGDHTQVGTYPLDIEGIGNYTGSIPDYSLAVVAAPSSEDPTAPQNPDPTPSTGDTDPVDPTPPAGDGDSTDSHVDPGTDPGTDPTPPTDDSEAADPSTPSADPGNEAPAEPDANTEDEPATHEDESSASTGSASETAGQQRQTTSKSASAAGGQRTLLQTGDTAPVAGAVALGTAALASAAAGAALLLGRRNRKQER
ncbi:hypothetical protein PZH32_08105 [Adlercreutzia equolifaciens]|uniref:hypothetical protein n=1 Tax=Adlercreutzia equolifaciens TaxID=446660 RepID=UPI0023B0AE0D|nr:hypothetical protein [Adlercreutzia equolifaciens]MDE8702926.1 hypothetical protein [Adlercreutzia equolifaciens]